MTETFENTHADMSHQNRRMRKRRLGLKVAGIYLTFFCFGYSMLIDGPSMPDLIMLLDTNTKSITGAYTAFSLGDMLGCILCGLVYERYSYELQLALAFTTMEIFTMLPPWTGSLTGFIVISAFKGISSGFYETGCTSYMINVMNGHRLQGPAVQALSCIWSLGAFVGPLVTRQFISASNTSSETLNLTMFKNMSTADSEVAYTPTRIGYSYVTLGVIGVLCSTPLWIMYATRSRKCIYKPKSSFISVTQQRNRKLHENVILMFIFLFLFLWFVFYIWAETPGTFLTIWTFKWLGWPKDMGPLLTSVYFGVHSVGRILGIPLAAFIAPRIMLLMCSLLSTSSFILLLFLNQVNDIAVWICVCCAALGLSCSWSSMLLWANKHIEISGRTSAVLLFGASIGASTGPLFTGMMFDNYSPQWFLYITTGAAVLCFVLFGLLEMLSKLRIHLSVNKHTEQ